MHAIREIIDRSQIANVTIPTHFGNKLEIIIMPASPPPADINAESWAHMKTVDETGFVREVLADPAEDVWNDLLADDAQSDEC